MFALVDCNNFYASCERLFRPELRNVPIVVLSNNDGCVIARSNEAKSLGVKMGTPWFKVDRLTQEQVTAFSSNYTLYADMSARVMNNLARFTPSIEVYSIDECFLNLSGFQDLESYAHLIRNTVIHSTGIPISIGIAPSKTLAKLANKLAKKTGVMVLDSPDKISVEVDSFPLEDVWGIGPAYFRKLSKRGISTAGQLRNMPLLWVQKNLTIQGARLWYELQGKSMIPVQLLQRKKGIGTSRSFGKLSGDFSELEEATANYTSRLAEKLRENKSCASILSVKLITNQFRAEMPQLYTGLTIALPYPTHATTELVKHALMGLKKIYKSGFKFMKVEVYATGLIPEAEVQLNLFQGNQTEKLSKLSKVMDQLNAHYGKGTLRIATEGYKQAWAMRQQFLSPSYTTNWNDIVKVNLEG